HQHDRALVDTQLHGIDPAQPRYESAGAQFGLGVEARVERIDETVLVVDRRAVAALHLDQRGHHDFRGEGDRTAGGGGCQRAIVANVVEAGAARGITLEFAFAVRAPDLEVAGSVAGRQAPHVRSVAGPFARIGDGVVALAESGAT